MSVVAGEPMPGRLQRRFAGPRCGDCWRSSVSPTHSDVAVGHLVVHDAGLDDVVRRADDGAHGAIQADRLGERAARIEPRQIGRRRARVRESPWPYHQGMPFCTNATGVSAPSSGPMLSASACWPDAFMVDQHGILRPEIGRPVARPAPAPRSSCRRRAASGRCARIASRWAPRATTGNLVAGRRESRREIPADGARAEYTNPHAPLSDPAVGWPARKRRKQPWPHKVNIADSIHRNNADLRPGWPSARRRRRSSPQLPIIDPHHHLWDTPARGLYFLPELLADIGRRPQHRLDGVPRMPVDVPRHRSGGDEAGRRGRVRERHRRA